MARPNIPSESLGNIISTAATADVDSQILSTALDLAGVAAQPRGKAVVNNKVANSVAIDTEMESGEKSDSDLSEIIESLQQRKHPAKIEDIRRTIPAGESQWLRKARTYIKGHPDSLEVPFPNAGNATVTKIEEAEGKGGGSQKVLKRLKELAHRVFAANAAAIFDEDAVDDHETLLSEDFGEDENSHSLLECVRHIMLMENLVLFTSPVIEGKDTSIGHKVDDAKNFWRPSIIPPGGVLNIRGIPGEEPPSLLVLRARGLYSNDEYWKFSPYLDPVCSTVLLKSQRSCIDLPL